MACPLQDHIRLASTDHPLGGPVADSRRLLTDISCLAARQVRGILGVRARL